MTAKEAGLWEPLGMVSREDVRHMQSRVLQFNATGALAEEDMASVPNCAESFARWLIVDACAYAAQPPRRVAPALSRAILPLIPPEAEAGHED